MAFLRQYFASLGVVNKPGLHETCTVTLVEQPDLHYLDACEDK